MEKVLRRGRLTWIVKDNSIVVFDNIQATVYAPYMSPNDNLFPQMKEFLLTSEDGEYSNWVDAVCLAQVCRMIGQGTRIPKVLDES